MEEVIEAVAPNSSHFIIHCCSHVVVVLLYCIVPCTDTLIAAEAVVEVIGSHVAIVGAMSV